MDKENSEIEKLCEKMESAGKSKHDVFVALSHILDCSVGEAKLATPDKKRVKCLTKIIETRIKKNKPIDKILKTKSFYGREFFVNDKVLSPRPETELLVEEVKKNVEILRSAQNDKDIKILDLCCGSGCIGVCLEAHIFADISKKALKVAKKNGAKNVVQGFLFQNIKEKFDIIVSNPPYISEKEFENLDPEVKNYDLKISLVAKDNGYQLIEAIIKQAPAYLEDGGMLFLEIGHLQGGLTVKFMEENGYKDVIVKQDYNGQDRIVYGIIKGAKTNEQHKTI